MMRSIAATLSILTLEACVHEQVLEPAAGASLAPLPEGVVEDGRSVAGVVYFESVCGRESAVEFEMTLADSSDGVTFGRVAIPFQTVGGTAR